MKRDGETGLDYFGARYYAPIPGRFLSPDPLLDSADPADPQTWNRYSYVFNRPMNSIDPDGRIPIDIANPSAGAPQPEEPIPPGQPLGAVLVVVTTLTPIPGDEVGVAAIVGGKLASRFGGRVLSAGRKLLDSFFSKAPSPSVPKGGVGPVLNGQAGVERGVARAQARGEVVLGREITIETPIGRTRPDLLTRTPAGNLRFVECKNGPCASLTTRQKKAFPLIERQGGIPRGGNAAAAGLEPGVPIGPTRILIERIR